MRKASERARIATRFVNIPGDLSVSAEDRRKMELFLLSYPGIRRLSTNPPPHDQVGILCDLAIALRGLWLDDEDRKAAALSQLHNILFDVSSVRVKNGTVMHVEGMPYPARINDSRRNPFSEPAIRLRLAPHWLVFRERDVLDGIARALLEAYSLGYLRQCAGSKKGWKCPTPYLVADEGRREHCYGTAEGFPGCGDQAKSEAKKAWHQIHASKENFRRIK